MPALSPALRKPPMPILQTAEVPNAVKTTLRLQILCALYVSVVNAPVRNPKNVLCL